MADGSKIGAMRSEFKRLHESFFVIPGARDPGEAHAIARHGFKAIGTTSVGLAASLGKGEQSISLAEAIANIQAVCGAATLPVDVDFQAGFADHANTLEANLALVAAAGASGITIDDRNGDHLFNLPAALVRLSAVRKALADIDPGIVLVGRTDGFRTGMTNLEATIDRLSAFASAGADVLFAPGLSRPDDIAAAVRAVAPKKLQVLLAGPHMRVHQLKALGVCRVTTGAFLSSAADRAYAFAAKSLAEEGALPADVFH